MAIMIMRLRLFGLYMKIHVYCFELPVGRNEIHIGPCNDFASNRQKPLSELMIIQFADPYACFALVLNVLKYLQYIQTLQNLNI